MEDKQQVVLNLLRAMSDLIYKLTFVSRDPASINGIDLSIRSVRKKLDEFESVFIDDGNKKDSDKMIEDLTDDINNYYYPIKSDRQIQTYDVKRILEYRYRERIRAIWRKKDKEIYYDE